jgi:hypothetical protein
MVPRGGIEYMAGGTGSHPKIWKASLGRQKQQQHQKQKPWGRGKANATSKPHPRAEVCLTTPISSYKDTEVTEVPQSLIRVSLMFRSLPRGEDRKMGLPSVP